MPHSRKNPRPAEHASTHTEEKDPSDFAPSALRQLNERYSIEEIRAAIRTPVPKPKAR